MMGKTPHAVGGGCSDRMDAGARSHRLNTTCSNRFRSSPAHRRAQARRATPAYDDDFPVVEVPVAVREDGLEYLQIGDIRDALARRPSPFCHDNNAGGGFVGDKDLLQIEIVQYESDKSSGAQCKGLSDPVNDTCITLPQFAIRSGPREFIYHDPARVTAAIVTCGGLCPGLNDVVLNIVTSLLDYGVPEDQVLGIRYGLRGFLDRHAKPIKLGRREVDGIQLKGGTGE
jgi:hypothetical protein